MDNKGEEAGLCGLAGLMGAVEGVFARKLAWRISSDKSSMVIQHFYSCTGKYEPVFILPLAMTRKTQDLGCL